MKKHIALLFFLSVLFIGCGNNYLYSFLAITNVPENLYIEDLNIIANEPEIVEYFPSLDFTPKIYDFDIVFNSYADIENYCIKKYGHKSKYNNKSQYELACQTGTLRVTGYDKVIRTYRIQNNNIQLISQKGGLHFNDLLLGYSENELKEIRKDFLKDFKQGEKITYYRFGNQIFKCSFKKGGHLSIIFDKIECITL